VVVLAPSSVSVRWVCETSESGVELLGCNSTPHPYATAMHGRACVDGVMHLSSQLSVLSVAPRVCVLRRGESRRSPSIPPLAPGQGAPPMDRTAPPCHRPPRRGCYTTNRS
jgi:hypothetical protein